MYQSNKKLKYIKEKLKEWNKCQFKNIFHEKIRIEKELTNLNKRIIEKGMEIEEYENEKSLKEDLYEIMVRGKCFQRKNVGRSSFENEIETQNKCTKF